MKKILISMLLTAAAGVSFASGTPGQLAMLPNFIEVRPNLETLICNDVTMGQEQHCINGKAVPSRFKFSAAPGTYEFGMPSDSVEIRSQASEVPAFRGQVIAFYHLIGKPDQSYMYYSTAGEADFEATTKSAFYQLESKNMLVCKEQSASSCAYIKAR